MKAIKITSAPRLAGYLAVIASYFSQLFRTLTDLYYYRNTVRYARKHGNIDELAWYEYLMDVEIKSLKSQLKYPFIKHKQIDENELPF
jgi:energy-converting hydrogenase Eha subunit F